MYLDSSDEFNWCRHQDTLEEFDLYQHVSCLAGQDSDVAIESMLNILWHANDYQDKKVRSALNRLMATPDSGERESSTQRYLFLINRCLYTIGNQWSNDPARHGALQRLILSVKETPKARAQNPTTRRLRDLVHTYTDSELYHALQRNMHLLDVEQDIAPDREPQVVGDCFKDYFYIHVAGGVTPDIPSSLREDFSKRSIRHLLRLIEDIEVFRSSYNTPNPTPNFTRLSDADLTSAIQDYCPRRRNSYYLQTREFVEQYPSMTMREVKAESSRLVLAPLISVHPRYSKNKFSRDLREMMDSVQGDNVPNHPLAITNLFRRLVRFLVCHEPGQLGSQYFGRLIQDVGHQAVTGMLLNTVLAFRNVRFTLETRLARLFERFETFSSESVPWLLQAFEHMNIALALNAREVGYIH